MPRRASPDQIRSARLAAGLSQQAVAEATGVRQATVSQYESGSWPIPLEWVWSCALACRRDPSEFDGRLAKVEILHVPDEVEIKVE